MTEFKFVCEQVQNINVAYTCDGLTEPVIVVSGIVRDHQINMFGTLRGVYYPGEKYVFIRDGMLIENEIRTIIHEITHYVLDFNGLTDRCLHEEYARYVAGQEPDEWRARYGCLKAEGNEDE